MKKSRILPVIVLSLMFTIGHKPVEPLFVKVKGTQFMRNGKPYRFMGANYWQGMNLGSQGESGDRNRLKRELDQMRSLGITNLRILALSEGPDGSMLRLRPSVQDSPGIFREELLQGLDFLLEEMRRRDMTAVVVLNNFWPWSGGMAQYNLWTGADSIPYPPPHGKGTWDSYQKYTAGFYATPKAIALYHQAVEKIIGRTNSISKKPYRDDPTIMSWQLANEPREFGHDKKYFKWVKKSSDLIRQLDENHLICIGNEGILDNLVGSTYKKTAALKNINYLTVHLWPENWGWYAPKNPDESFETTRRKSIAYLEKNAEVSKMVLKPIVLEEFGLARDGGSYEASAEVNMRNKFYQFLYETTLGNPNSPYRGMNFWAIGGEGRPRQPETFWQAGDDYIGDPPHEKQGWYSVYFTDSSTFEWLKKVQK